MPALMIFAFVAKSGVAPPSGSGSGSGSGAGTGSGGPGSGTGIIWPGTGTPSAPPASASGSGTGAAATGTGTGSFPPTGTGPTNTCNDCDCKIPDTLSVKFSGLDQNNCPSPEPEAWHSDIWTIFNGAHDLAWVSDCTWELYNGFGTITLYWDEASSKWILEICPDADITCTIEWAMDEVCDYGGCAPYKIGWNSGESPLWGLEWEGWDLNKVGDGCDVNVCASCCFINVSPVFAKITTEVPVTRCVPNGKSDSFERADSDTVGNGWTETEFLGQPSDVKIEDNSLWVANGTVGPEWWASRSKHYISDIKEAGKNLSMLPLAWTVKDIKRLWVKCKWNGPLYYDPLNRMDTSGAGFQIGIANTMLCVGVDAGNTQYPYGHYNIWTQGAEYTETVGYWPYVAYPELNRWALPLEFKLSVEWDDQTDPEDTSVTYKVYVEDMDTPLTTYEEPDYSVPYTACSFIEAWFGGLTISEGLYTYTHAELMEVSWGYNLT